MNTDRIDKAALMVMKTLLEAGHPVSPDTAKLAYKMGEFMDAERFDLHKRMWSNFADALDRKAANEPSAMLKSEMHERARQIREAQAEGRAGPSRSIRNSWAWKE